MEGRELTAFVSPGKIYTLGPGESLSNFETHLTHKLHLEKRKARESKGRGGKA